MQIPNTPWEIAVQTVATRAKAALGDASKDRIDKAVTIVLAGGVHLNDDASAVVESQSEPLKGYAVNGACPCADFAHAPSQLCKHRIACYLHRRALELAQAPSTPAPSCQPLDFAPPEAAREPSQPVALPEAPASVNCHLMLHGRKIQLTLRDTDETRLLQRLSVVLAQYPAPESPTAAPTPGASAVPPQAEASTGLWCALHGVPLKQQSNARGTWWSHKLSEGGYCKGKQGR